MNRAPKYLLLASLLCVPSATQAKPAPEPKLSQSRRADLAYQAFGAIYVDSDLEEAEARAEVLGALQAGLSSNERNEFGQTLLLEAIANGRGPVMLLLLARAAPT